MSLATTVAAVDLGASSGRVVLGHIGRDRLHVEAVARFAHEPVRLPDGLHWNLLELYTRALGGLQEAVRRTGAGLASVGVDSWAVDYGLLGDGRLLGIPFCYRDEQRTAGVATVHAVVPHAELFDRNGLQPLPFTTLYQLAADAWVDRADRLLLVPDLIANWLTGEALTERTNASTTGLLDVHTGKWDLDLAERLGFPPRILGPLVDPGDPIGPVLPPVGELVGQPGLPVTAVGSHDTASAVVGAPLSGADTAYLSCGTWGLVGLELETPVLSDAAREAGFTNERGVDGRVRFLTNVMGTWLLSETLRTWQRRGWSHTLAELLAAAADVHEPVPIFDVQDPRFLPPGDMPARIAACFTERDLAAPAGPVPLVRSIVESLAQAFADALESAATLARRPVRTVHLVGGGALNHLLCQAVARRSGRRVVAGPVEATAIGNVLVQARTAGGLSGSLESLRDLVARTQDLAEFRP